MRFAVFAALFAVSATASFAAPVGPPTGPSLPLYYDLNFSFLNLADGAEIVEGVVRGLSTNGTSAAYSLEVTANSNGYGFGEFIANTFANEWVLSGGSLISYNFASFNVITGPGELTSLVMSNLPGSPIEGLVGLDLGGSSVDATPIDTANLMFSIARSYDTYPFPSPVTAPANPTAADFRIDGSGQRVSLAPIPLPAAIYLMLAGLGALGLTRLRRA